MFKRNFFSIILMLAPCSVFANSHKELDKSRTLVLSVHRTLWDYGESAKEYTLYPKYSNSKIFCSETSNACFKQKDVISEAKRQNRNNKLWILALPITSIVAIPPTIGTSLITFPYYTISALVQSSGSLSFFEGNRSKAKFKVTEDFINPKSFVFSKAVDKLRKKKLEKNSDSNKVPGLLRNKNGVVLKNYASKGIKIEAGAVIRSYREMDVPFLAKAVESNTKMSGIYFNCGGVINGGVIDMNYNWLNIKKTSKITGSQIFINGIEF